jgi:hypothetical protein
MAEIEKKLTVEKGDIDMFQDTNMGDMVIFKMEYKTVEITVTEEDINMSEDIDTNKKNLIFQFVEFVDIKFLEMVETVVNKEEYNTAEVHKELTVEKGDIHMFEDIHMRNVYIVKFVEVVKKVFYYGEDNVAGMQEELPVKEEKGTRKSEDFWKLPRHGEKTLILKGEGVS